MLCLSKIQYQSEKSRLWRLWKYLWIQLCMENSEKTGHTQFYLQHSGWNEDKSFTNSYSKEDRHLKKTKPLGGLYNYSMEKAWWILLMVGFLCRKNEVMYRPKLFETSRYNDIPKKNLLAKFDFTWRGVEFLTKQTLLATWVNKLPFSKLFISIWCIIFIVIILPLKVC